VRLRRCRLGQHDLLAVELAFRDQPDLVEIARRALGAPRHVIGTGLSIGGIITAGVVQECRKLLSGALPMCGKLAGAVAVHNGELDWTLPP
jgi:predicted esterase